MAGKSITTANLVVALNEYTISSWDDLPQTDPQDEGSKLKQGLANATGNPVRKWTINAVNNGLKTDEVEDILLLMTYKLA
jgi:hypothetical protein